MSANSYSCATGETKTSFLKYAAFLFGVAVFAAVAADFVLSARDKGSLSRKVFLAGWVAPPNASIYDGKTNKQGFVGDVLALKKPAGKRRVLLLGGSAAFVNNITGRLKTSLAKSETADYEVVGAAMPAHTSRSSVLKFSLLAPYRFNYVFIYHGINDLWANNVRRESYKDDYSHINSWYKSNALLKNCYLCRLLYNSTSETVANGGALPTAETENAARFRADISFRNNLKRLLEDIQESGAEPILLTFASNIAEDYSISAFNEKKLGYADSSSVLRTPIELWGSPEYVQEGLKRANNTIRMLGEELAVPIIDQQSRLSSDISNFQDVCHLSAVGAERFVKNIADYLLKN